jgi:hypothetical protein
MQRIESEYRHTPAYEIKNSGISGYELSKALLTPNSNNTISDRFFRLYRERMYITYNDRWDKLLLVVIVISFIVSMVVLFRSINLNATQVYQFNNPEDAENEENKETLDAWNNTLNHTGWIFFRVLLAAFPVLISFWRLFKRTTIPSNEPSNRRRATRLQQLGQVSRDINN